MTTDTSAFTVPHLRPTFLLNTPCLVSHYCLRPKQENDPVHLDRQMLNKPNAPSAIEPKIVDPINRYLKAVAAAAKADGVTPQFTMSATQATPRKAHAKMVHYTSTLGWRLVLPDLNDGAGVDLDIVVDIYTEYFSICIHAFPRVKASWPQAPDCPDGGSLAETLCWLTEAHGADVPDDDVADRVIDQLYDGFWKQLFGKFPAPDDVAAGLGADCFAVFRGAVIRNTSVDAQRQLSAAAEREQKDWSPAYAPKLVKETYEEGGAPRDMTKPKEIQKDLVAFANRKSIFFTRLLHFREGGSWIDDYLGGNAILCAPLEGLALYGSSMGAERLGGNGEETNLVRYFIIYGGPSRNQLGRLVRRLHTAGECRIGALFDFDTIRAAGNQLRYLELRSGSNAHPDGTTLQEWRDVLANSAKAGRGGLMQRQGRTNYYGAILHQRVKEMRLSRIVGWQTYEEFITRQVDPHLDTIDRISQRFRDLEARLRRLTDVQMVARFGALAQQTHDTNVAIAEGNDRIELVELAAQLVGAVVLLCALVEALPQVVKAWYLKHHWRPPADPDLILGCAGFALLVVLVASALFWLVRWRLRQIGKARRNADADQPQPPVTPPAKRSARRK